MFYKNIYNGIDLEEFKDFRCKKDFKKKQNIQNKILVSYAGILSPYQGLNNILDAADLLKNEENIIFYIIGDGSDKKNLENRIKNEDIFNVKLLPFQPREEYFNI